METYDYYFEDVATGKEIVYPRQLNSEMEAFTEQFNMRLHFENCNRKYLGYEKRN